MSEYQENKRLTIGDIESKQFHRVTLGYEQREVDEFLDCICDEMELLQKEIEELKRRADYANAETRKVEASSGAVAPATLPESSFREILEMAQRVKEQTIADAQMKAEEIIAEAQMKADALLGTLEEERERLQGTVDALHQQARSYRDALAEMIRGHQETLDQFELGE